MLICMLSVESHWLSRNWQSFHSAECFINHQNDMPYLPADTWRSRFPARKYLGNTTKCFKLLGKDFFTYRVKADRLSRRSLISINDSNNGLKTPELYKEKMQFSFSWKVLVIKGLKWDLPVTKGGQSFLLREWVVKVLSSHISKYNTTFRKRFKLIENKTLSKCVGAVLIL